MPDAVVGFPVDLHAKYEANVNTALKGVAIAARRCLEDRDLHLACAPRFRDNRNELTASVYPLLERPPDPDAPDVEVLTVARATDYRVLAGRGEACCDGRPRAAGHRRRRRVHRRAAVATARSTWPRRDALVGGPRVALRDGPFDGRAEETILEVVAPRRRRLRRLARAGSRDCPLDEGVVQPAARRSPYCRRFTKDAALRRCHGPVTRRGPRSPITFRGLSYGRRRSPALNATHSSPPVRRTTFCPTQLGQPHPRQTAAISTAVLAIPGGVGGPRSSLGKGAR